MKVLCINVKPDFTYFTKRGLNLEVEYKTVKEVFPLKYLYDAKNQNGVTVSFYTPWPEQYLEANYKEYKYSAIFVGWNPMDYNNSTGNTGGYTYHSPIKSGIRWATVRQDTVPNNNYPLHELMHVLTGIINIDFGHHVPIDFMDTDRQKRPYYKNEQPEAPDGNFAQTWAEVNQWLPRLNAIKYAQDAPEATLTRLYDWGRETVGKLVVGDGSGFVANTLELGWKANQTNISSIPTETYDVKWTWSNAFMRYCYEIQKVPNRSGIRLHSVSFYSSLRGCIGLGRGFSNLDLDGLPDLNNSKKTILEFETLMNKRPFTLIIK